VHVLRGHIACDAASRSEIVVPLFKAFAILGVLDVRVGLESLVEALIKGSQF
jgi:GAF domain-containing protein